MRSPNSFGSYPPNNPNWHSIDTLPTGERVGKLGAMTYLINEQDEPVSRGYHEIEPGRGVGRIGNRTEPIRFVDQTPSRTATLLAAQLENLVYAAEDAMDEMRVAGMEVQAEILGLDVSSAKHTLRKVKDETDD